MIKSVFGIVQFQIAGAFPLAHRDEVQRVLKVFHVRQENNMVQAGKRRARSIERHVGTEFWRVDVVLGKVHDVAHVGN